VQALARRAGLAASWSAAVEVVVDLVPVVVGGGHGALRSALSQAVTEDLITRNVAAPVKLTTPRSRKGNAWSGEEARRFLESARDDLDPLYGAYVLVLVLGLRKGEVLGRTWDDVDLDQGELSIGFQLQRVGRQLLHRETKTEGSEATLPLPDICATALKFRREQQEHDRAVAGPKWQGSRLVFTTRYGTPIEPRNFNRAYDVRIVKAGVRKITVHDARRTCATMLADLDVHPRVAMQVLRHAKFSITMEIYTQVSSTATREALKPLGAARWPLVAVLRCCTGTNEAIFIDGRWPLTLSGWRDLNPRPLRPERAIGGDPRVFEPGPRRTRRRWWSSGSLRVHPCCHSIGHSPGAAVPPCLCRWTLAGRDRGRARLLRRRVDRMAAVAEQAMSDAKDFWPTGRGRPEAIAPVSAGSGRGQRLDSAVEQGGRP
jgi:integrase